MGWRLRRQPKQPRQSFVQYVAIAIFIQFGFIANFHFSPSATEGGWGDDLKQFLGVANEARNGSMNAGFNHSTNEIQSQSIANAEGVLKGRGDDLKQFLDVVNETRQNSMNAGPNNSMNQRQSTSHKWAYAFLMAGCDSKTRGHVGYLYNILASSHILRASGSKADVVVMVGTYESSLTLFFRLFLIHASCSSIIYLRFECLFGPTRMLCLLKRKTG